MKIARVSWERHDVNHIVWGLSGKDDTVSDSEITPDALRSMDENQESTGHGTVTNVKVLYGYTRKDDGLWFVDDADGTLGPFADAEDATEAWGNYGL